MLCKRRLNLLLFWRSPCCSLRASGSRVTSRDSPKWRALLAGYRYRAVLVAKTPYNLKTDPCGQRQQYHRQDTALECLTQGVKHGRIADSRTVACSRLSDGGEDAKEKGTRKVGGVGKRKGERASAVPALLSFLPFYFRVCAFSIQRTRLSRSLEQATRTPDKNARFFKHQVRCMKSSAKW